MASDAKRFSETPGTSSSPDSPPLQSQILALQVLFPVLTSKTGQWIYHFVGILQICVQPATAPVVKLARRILRRHKLNLSDLDSNQAFHKSLRDFRLVNYLAEQKIVREKQILIFFLPRTSSCLRIFIAEKLQKNGNESQKNVEIFLVFLKARMLPMKIKKRGTSLFLRTFLFFLLAGILFQNAFYCILK